MPQTLTIVLLSGSSENQDAVFACNLARAVLERGDKVNIFLYGNACNLANQSVPLASGRSPISDGLRAHMDRLVLTEAIQELTAKGARVATCHTTEYSRGTEGLAYLDGVEWGDVGDTYNRFLLSTDRLITIGR